MNGRYKLIIDIFKDEYFIELYDLSIDQQEMKNLSFDKDYYTIVDEMIDQLRILMKQTKDLQVLPRNLLKKLIKRYKYFN